MGMTGRGRTHAAALVASAAVLTAATPVPAPDLPPDLPERRAGLWEIRTLGHLPGAIKTYEERTRICVDAAVDRALYRADLEAKAVTVADRGGACDAPVHALDGHRLSMTMHCSSAGAEGRAGGQTIFESTTTFAGPDLVTVVHRRVDPGNTVFAAESVYHDTMTRIGACAPGQRPGDRIRLESLLDGSESQNSRRIDNLFDASRTPHKMMEDLLAAYRRAEAAAEMWRER